MVADEAAASTAARAMADRAPSDSAEVIVRVDEVFRFFETEGERSPVLKGISFDLERGSFTTIMGPSGSGKSTLLHLLAGLDVPDAGVVEIAGASMSAAGSEEQRAALRRRHIGFIFQFFNLLPDLSVRDNIVLPLLIAGERPERFSDRVDRLLALLSIDGLGARLPSRLSGGELQRVSIARALVVEPAVLFADEPTGNLSSKAGEEIIGLLRDVSDRLGTTVLLVTHNPRDAARGDRVLFLHDGLMRPEQALTGGGFSASDVYGRLEELGI